MEMDSALLHDLGEVYGIALEFADMKQRMMDHFLSVRSDNAGDVVEPTQCSKTTVNSLLMQIAGNNIMDLLRTFRASSADPTVNANKLLSTIEDLFIPKLVIMFQRYKFSRCRQRENEDVGLFLAKLHWLTETCQFVNREKRIMDQFVKGVRSDHLREHLQELEIMDFDRIKEICSQLESRKYSRESCTYCYRCRTEGNEGYQKLEHHSVRVMENDRAIKTSNVEQIVVNLQENKADLVSETSDVGTVKWTILVSAKKDKNAVEPKMMTGINKNEGGDNLIGCLSFPETEQTDNIRSETSYNENREIVILKQNDKMTCCEGGDSDMFDDVTDTDSDNDSDEDKDNEVIEMYDRTVAAQYGNRDILNLHENEKRDEELINIIAERSDSYGCTERCEVIIVESDEDVETHDAGSVCSQDSLIHTSEEDQGFQATWNRLSRMIVSPVERTMQFPCQYCGKFFASPSECYRHVRELHIEQLPYKCSKCGDRFLRETSLRYHLVAHLKKQQRRCDECGVEVKSMRKMYQHKRTCHNFDPYICQYCGKFYSRPSSLKVHLMSHTGERPYVCEICGATYRQWTDLSRHRQAAHTGERPYKCSYCGHGFVLMTGLKIHERRHTGERPYVCNICGGGFHTTTALKYHQRQHTGERPYKCTVCSRGFTLRRHLHAHKHIHTGVKPYTCQICHAKFSRSYNMKSHMRVKHGMRDMKISEKTALAASLS